VFRRILAFTALAATVSMSAPAESGVIDSSNTGWYDSFGDHTSSNPNYIAGDIGGSFFHDFFVFDLSGLSQPIVAATVRVFNPDGGYSSANTSETYALFDVSTAIPTLIADQSGQTSIFDDLGSGVSYGSQTVSAADDGKFVEVTLNADGLAALNSALGSQFAFGGALLASADPFIFGGSDSNFVLSNVQLDLTSVPEPAGTTLAVVAIGGFLVARYRRNSPMSRRA
jgi:hypothetical protein